MTKAATVTVPMSLRLGLALPLLVLNVFVLRQLLLPLAPFPALILTAALIAFLLDIPSRWLTGRGVPRLLALALVLGLGLGLLVLVSLVLVPRLVDQLGDLLKALPRWLVQGELLLNEAQSWATAHGLPADFGDLSSELLTRSTQLASQLSQRLLSLLGATLTLTINTLVVIVLAVFLLIGGESISRGLGRWLPASWRAMVLGTLYRTFRGYFAGQVVLALILSAAQIVVFALLAIPYGVLFAVAIGFTTLIPYASAFTIVLVSGLLALDDPRTGLEVLVAAITVGQVVDQIIQPRLMGQIVGLQPAWLLVSLPIGARIGSLLGLGGLLGLLLAVPVASCLKTFLDELACRLGLPEPGEIRGREAGLDVRGP
ncbi:AI-2E family transporter [Synechococcus sp. CS-602]|uniref:AI-2E family transporter n=1 Tax=Synechococcaceae TaxID=1890426 RepID=UPI0009FAB7B8|nr:MULTISPECIES: AI-2E family transporter [Synechococcaceae]MCT4364074.1 AI-2E family transporter [Candidatus Regnicoccus frigidus MAG-AL1]MCT0201409.1 AI-2E family transporter [Synechococcus sp. CS-603]MCT0205960.1 AI-2E family transporter [Synechococcus sp. CS-602]MCT0246317.1 AI-2E family transporter [Synechococcus sp. CS-601]MCT4366379.1 AI-2E family transporter [Candidatus Regnicoccus frigidus MAG-AL2]